MMEIQFLKFIVFEVVHHDDFFSFCSYCISSSISYWRYLLKINVSISFVSAWHSFILCPWPWWKRQNLLRFLVFEPLFIGGEYCKKSFPFVTANTLSCLIVRGMVMILGDDKRSYMCFLVIFLDVFVRDR
jgi:hypothetical protein